MSRTDSQRKFMQFEQQPDESVTNGPIYLGSLKYHARKYLILVGLGVLLLVVGIILIVFAYTRLNTCGYTPQHTPQVGKKQENNACGYSNEAKRVKLGDFLTSVREEYFKIFPEEIAWYPLADVGMIKERFRVHDPKPGNIKKITEKAQFLLTEAKQLKPDLSKLKPREHKAYLQMLHFLENTFAYSYLNYTAGLWLLGPSGFCSEPICLIGYAIYNSIGSITPSTVEDVELILRHFRDFNQSLFDYIDVLKMGIQKGMVRTSIECRSGIDALKAKHLNITKNGAKGVKGEWYVKQLYEDSHYKNVTEELNEHFVQKFGKNVSVLIQHSVVEYIGKPLEKVLAYLDGEHYLHCRPNDYGAGGLGALPLDVIFYNGSIVPNRTTDPTLPLCNDTVSSCRLNGSRAYAAILGYFTTKDIKPDEVHQLGWQNLNRLYPQVIDIAKNVTNELNESVAIPKFQAILGNFTLSYFHDQPLPENETKGEAFLKCTDEESAKKYCPHRWAAMMKWFRFAQMTMSIHDPNTVDFFYFTGDTHSTPNCPVEMRPDFNPSSGAQSYDGSDELCSRPCFYNIPFFLEHLGPKFSEYSVNAHEARPGHHTQVQGLEEHFRDKCGGPEAWLDDKTYYTAFTEGWALYGENPLIAQDTNVYADNPMQKFGMLKWQIWRALRLIVDTGMHYKNMTRNEALQLFEKYAWDNTDLSKKEVTRYQSNYGQATAYMIGQLDIWMLRNQTEQKLMDLYSIKDFHLQALSQGSSPLAYLASYMKKYVSCKQNETQQHCDIVLNPTQASDSTSQYFRNGKMKWPVHRHYL